MEAVNNQLTASPRPGAGLSSSSFGELIWSELMGDEQCTVFGACLSCYPVSFDRANFRDLDVNLESAGI
eukprot:450626-Prymnesium_polylepis.1